MVDLPILMATSAFLVGVAGGVHCAGMCGGIVAAISRSGSARNAPWRYGLAHNGGRILSYGFAGLLVGALGGAGLLFRDAAWLQQSFAFVASLMLLILGLSLAGIVPFARRIEFLGAALWRRIQPLSRRLLPVDSAPRAFALGLLWGWLPCGLVYTVLLTALATANPVGGATVMLAFGFGTLPNLVGLGALISHSKNALQSRRARLAAGVLVLGFGSYGFARALAGTVLSPAEISCHVPRLVDIFRAGVALNRLGVPSRHCFVC